MPHWNYSEARKPPMPVMRVILKTLDGKISYPMYPGEDREIGVDTGYDGSVLVPDYVYFDVLHLDRFEMPEKGEIETPFGEKEELYLARAFAVFPPMNVKIEALVETFMGCREMLAGRELLNKYVLTLNGPERKLYV